MHRTVRAFERMENVPERTRQKIMLLLYVLNEHKLPCGREANKERNGSRQDEQLWVHHAQEVLLSEAEVRRRSALAVSGRITGAFPICQTSTITARSFRGRTGFLWLSKEPEQDQGRSLHFNGANADK